MQKVMFRWNTQDWCRLLVTGRDAKKFLHGMLTNDIMALLDSGGCFSAMVSHQGKTLALVYVYQISTQKFLLITESTTGNSLQETLNHYIVMEDVYVDGLPLENLQLGLYGPAAKMFLQEVYQRDFNSKLTVCDEKDGQLTWCVENEEWGPGQYGLIGSKQNIQALLDGNKSNQNFKLHELSAVKAEVYRIASGRPRYGVELTADRLPLESGLSHIINFRKGCYVGQEVINRLHSKDLIARELVGFSFSAPDVAQDFVGTTLSHPDKIHAGVISSSVQSLVLGPIGLGYVHRLVAHPGTIFYFQSQSHKEPICATVQKLPFNLAVGDET